MNANSFLQRTVFSDNPQELTTTHREDLREMFRILDVDQTGKVPIGDLKSVMESIGAVGRNSMVYHLLIYHEHQGKSYIDLSDFMQIMSQPLNNVESEDDCEKVFSRFDPTLEYIDYERLRQVAADLEEAVDPAYLREMIRLADPDGDGRVSFDDFYDLMTTKLSKKSNKDDNKSKIWGTKDLISSTIHKKNSRILP